MPHNRPRIIIAAIRGGSGKTILSLGLIAAWCEKGHRIAPFKKGPDFIDAGWLAFAASQLCHNLDTFLMDQNQILESFFTHSRDANVSVIEGNRGLYDGLDLDGYHSTAELAKLLKTPVLLVVDVTMATRTMAAVVKGCQTFDKGLNIAGVILNRVASSRQETLVREAIEKYCGTPVLGAVPKLGKNYFPERHMGLVPYQERGRAEKAIAWAKRTAKENLQLDEIWRIAHDTEVFSEVRQDEGKEATVKASAGQPRVGFIRDRSFWFYYPENLEQLERMGAVLVEVNAILDKELPPLSALYIGGGFPESQAKSLAGNQSFRDSVKDAIEGGLPVYAECGGFMYLGENLIVEGKAYPMVGAVPVTFVLQDRPQGHGYTILEVDGSNPYYRMGEILKGHEFHYSKAFVSKEEEVQFAFKVRRGRGVDKQRDGLCKKNLLATFTHVHATGDARWAKNLYRAAVDYEMRQGKNFRKANKRTIDRNKFSTYTNKSK